MEDMNFFLDAFVDACDVLTKYNTVTHELYIYKTERGMVDPPNIIADAEVYIHKLIESGIIHRDDSIFFEDLFDNVTVRALCEHHQNGSVLVYRRKKDEHYIWYRLSMFVPRDYSQENPFIVAFSRNLPDAEADMFQSWELMGSQIHKVVKVNLTKNTQKTLKEHPFETAFRKSIRQFEYMKEKDFAREGFVHPEDAASFERHLDHDYIRNYFREGNSDYRFYYRRKVRGLYRWVQLTILTSADYSPENEEFFYYVGDVHKTILKLLDIRAATKYAQFFAERKALFSEGYYENLLEILSSFTAPYIDYYLIDLEKDLYINYKLSRNPMNEDIPYVGNYTQITADYLMTNYSGEEKKQLLAYSSSEKLRELFRDRLTLEYDFTYPTGQRVTTTMMKIESRNGVPTKILASTSPAKSQDKLVIQTFGNFEILHPDGTPVRIKREQSRQLLAYLIDRQGYPVTSKDIVADILEKDPSDMKAIKYVSTMIRRAIQELEEAGYPNVIIKEHKSVRVNIEAVDCDYYHFLNGDHSYWRKYHNEYMKEYSWAEETNAELLQITGR